MKAAQFIRSPVRFGVSLSVLSVLSWLTVLVLPPVPDSDFTELEAQRNEEVARRMADMLTIQSHRPDVLAGRYVGPFVNPAISLLTLASFPAFVAAKRQVAPPTCSDLPLLKVESWRAFYLVLAYSALMWFTLGALVARVLVGITRALTRDHGAAVGAG